VVWPRGDDDLGKWMQWLMTSQVRRHHRRHATSGHVWGGRFKSFPIQRRRPTASERAMGVVETANPLWTVLRYVERNPLRAKLVARPEDWRWSSLRWAAGLEARPAWVDQSWLERPEGWLEWVNAPEPKDELGTVRRSVARGAPFGTATWISRIAVRLGLESSLRPRGRPRKETKSAGNDQKK